MDVEQLNVVLTAQTVGLARGLESADAMMAQTRREAATLSTTVAGTGASIASTGGAAEAATSKHRAHANALAGEEKAARGGIGSFMGLGRAMAFASNAFLLGAGTGFILKKIYDETTQLQEAQAQLGHIVDNTGGSWKAQGAAVESYLTHLEDLSKFAPVQLTNDLTRLDGVTQNVAASERDLALATNIARARHMDLERVVNALVLAESGRTMGLTRIVGALPKVTTEEDALKQKLAELHAQGLALTASEKSRAEALAKSADGAATFALAVDGLTKKWGAGDKVFGASASGKMADLRLKFDRLAESVGGVLVPEIDKAVTSLDHWFTKLEKTGQAQRDVRETLTVIGDVFHTIDPVIGEVTRKVGGFETVVVAGLGVAGTVAVYKIGSAFWAAGEKAVVLTKNVYGLGASAAGAAGRILGIGGAADEAAVQTDESTMTMQDSIAALTASVDRLDLTFSSIATTAATAAAETNVSLGGIGLEADALQLQIDGIDTAFATVPVSAATAATETELSLIGIGEAADATALSVAGIGTAALALAGPLAALATIPLWAAGDTSQLQYAAAQTYPLLDVVQHNTKAIKNRAFDQQLGLITGEAQKGAITKAAAEKWLLAHSQQLLAAGVVSPIDVERSTTLLDSTKAPGPTGANSPPGAGRPAADLATFQLRQQEQLVAQEHARVKAIDDQLNKLLAGATPKPLKPTAFPSAVADMIAQASAEPKTVAGYQARIAIEERALKIIEAEHETGKLRTEQLQKEATLTNAIAAARERIVALEQKAADMAAKLPVGLATAATTARATLTSSPTLSDATKYLDILEESLSWLAKRRDMLRGETGDQKALAIIATERTSIEAKITGATRTVEHLQIGAREDRILGIGPAALPTSIGLQEREHKMLVDFARKSGMDVQAMNNESLSAIIKGIEGWGISLPAAMVASLDTVNEIFKNKFISPEALAAIKARLSQVSDTLKHPLLPSNYAVTSAEQLLKGSGLTGEKLKEAESRIAQAAAHHFLVPTGKAAAGVALTAGNTPETHVVTQHVTINIVHPNPETIGDQVVKKLQRTALSSGTQRRGRATNLTGLFG